MSAGLSLLPIGLYRGASAVGGQQLPHVCSLDRDIDRPAGKGCPTSAVCGLSRLLCMRWAAPDTGSSGEQARIGEELHCNRG